MSRKYTQEEVNEIVQEALRQQQIEIDREKRLADIEDAIVSLREDVDKLLENSKKVGF